MLFSSAGGIKRIKANDWYNTNWSYRIPITINSSTSLTDYQIKVEISSSNTDFWNHVQPDARDVKFTEEGGETLLSYWIEKWNTTSGSESTTIWIKVPNIPNGTKIIYLYYGNSSATGNGWHTNPDNPSSGWYAGDGDNTFIFFDDFEGNSLNEEKWDKTTNASGTVNVNNGEVLFDSGTAEDGEANIESKASINKTNLIWEARYKVWSDYNPNSLYRIRFSLVNVNFRGYDDYGIFSFNWDHTFYPIQYFWDTGGVTGYTGILATVDKWMKSIETLYSSGKNLEWKTIREDGSQEFERTGDVTSDENKYLSFRCGESRLYVGKLSVDYTFVRKYTDNEPTITILSSLSPLIEGTAIRGGYFAFFVDRVNETWLLTIPGKGYITGWMPFDRLRDTGNFMSGHYADRRYHLLFDWYSSGRYHLIFNDRRAGISIKFAGR